MFDGAAERYVMDENVAKRLKEANPEAFRNIISRMLEANGRGFWRPRESVLLKLQELYDDVDDEIESIVK